MASNRHLGRIIALQTLYEYEFRERSGDWPDLDDILKRNLSRYEKAIDDKDFVKKLVNGVVENATHLDARLTPLAPDWPIAQIAAIDRTILRMSVYEMENFADIVPPKVVINEAVELAKSFGSENSSKFINGVLGTLYRELYPSESGETLLDNSAPLDNENPMAQVPNGEMKVEEEDGKEGK